MNEDVELILSNNGSTKNIEGYQQIRELASPYLKYHEFDSNQDYCGNLHQVIRMSSGQFCLILSDEDSLYMQNLPDYLAIMEHRSDLSLIKGASSRYRFQEDHVYSAGTDAIQAFYMYNNYVSGIIYNRSVITDQLLDLYKTEYGTCNMAYHYYPHMMYDAYALLHGNCLLSSIPLVRIGETDGIQTTEQEQIYATVTGSAYSSYELRLEQWKGFIEQICDMKIDELMTVRMISIAIIKYNYLISIAREQYEAYGEDWNTILQRCITYMSDIIYTLDITDAYKPFLIDKVRNILEKE